MSAEESVAEKEEELFDAEIAGFGQVGEGEAESGERGEYWDDGPDAFYAAGDGAGFKSLSASE